MVSPGLLLLLLVFSSLPVPSIAPPGSQESSAGEQATNRFPNLAGLLKWLKHNWKDITDILATPLKVGPLAKFLQLFFPAADKLQSVYNEVKASYSKLDTINAEAKWVDYQKAINNVEHAWIKYTHMVHNQQITGGKLKDVFLTFYSQYADSSLVLYQYLTAEPVSITQTLGDLLAERLRCHEADLRKQFDYLNELMCKGNELDKRYYEFKALKSDARIKTGEAIASKSAEALFKSQKQCIANIDHYIAMDVFDLIDHTKKHQDIADDIRQFLKKTYTRYDWMVVAFSTHNTKDLPKWRKLHILMGFTEVERGTVTVAVAKQMKGSRSTKLTEMKKAIRSCLPTKVSSCNNIAGHLQKCDATFLDKPVSQIYTAVHTYRRHSQTSTDAESLPEDDEDLPDSSISLSNEQAYMYKGDCGKIVKKFTVGIYMILIKSEEEITDKDPCLKKSCKNKGICVKPDNKIAMCECKFPYYGEECEKFFKL